MHSRKILLLVRSTTWGNDYSRKRCTEQCGGQPFPAGTGGTLLLPTRKDLQVSCSVGCPLSTFHAVLDKGMRWRQGNPCPCPRAGLRRSMPTAARQEGGRGISAKLCSLGPGKSLSVLNPLQQAGCAQNVQRTVMAAPAWPPLAGRPSPGCATSGVVSSTACC